MESTANTSKPFEKTIFSAPFNALNWFGAWTIHTKSSIKKKTYTLYQLIMIGIALALVYALCNNMIVIFGDIKKFSWNVCVTILFTGALAKGFSLYAKRHTLNSLRLSLHKDFESRNTSENVDCDNPSLKLYKKIRYLFHVSLSFFGPLWIVARFLSRSLPIPVELPVRVDLEIYFNYVIIFGFLSLVSLVGVTFVVEQEVAMFAIMLQVVSEYEIFLSDIPKLNESLSNEWTEKDVCRRTIAINSVLQQKKTKMCLKQLTIRQQTLLKYTQILEYCYNQAMFIQVLVITIIAVAIAIQCILLDVVYLPEFTFQLGYLVIVLIDLFLVCFILTNLSTQCRAVGHALYDTRWYEMDLSVQRDLSFMMLISQNPATVTVMKATEVNLHAFQKIIQHIYSWLALFRQLWIK